MLKRRLQFRPLPGLECILDSSNYPQQLSHVKRRDMSFCRYNFFSPSFSPVKVFIAQCTITRYSKPCIFVASTSKKYQEEYIIPITHADGKFPRNHYANPRFVSDRTGSEFLRRDTLAPLSASSSTFANINSVLYGMYYSVLPRASSRPLTPTNRRGRKASETFFYPYAILSIRGFLLRLLEHRALARVGHTP